MSPRYDVSPMLRSLAMTLALLLCATPSRATAVEDPDREIARRHFTHGAELYEAGRYEEAIAEFQAARSVMRSPALDYNIARCHDRLEHLREAIDYYERFLASNPPEGQDSGARARVAVLRARLPLEPAAPVTEAPGVRQAAPAKAPYPVVVPAVLGGVALASLVAGGAVYGVSGGRYDDLVASGCGTTRLCGEPDWSGTRTMERAGIGLLVAGGLVAAVDIGLWVGWATRRRGAR